MQFKLQTNRLEMISKDLAVDPTHTHEGLDKNPRKKACTKPTPTTF